MQFHGLEIIRPAIALVRTVAEGRCCNLASEREEDPDSLDINYKESDGWTDRSSHFTMYSGDSSP